MNNRRFVSVIAGMVSLLVLVSLYDPLALASGQPRIADATWRDAKRSREVPIRLFQPDSKYRGKRPVVIFSHGLGGSRTNNPFLGEHLAKRGYLTVFVQHPGSDESVWRGVPLGQRMSAMQRAANAQNLRLRVEDVKFVLDELPRNRLTRDRADLKKVGMSGHSFGAGTTQGLSGQTYGPAGQAFLEPRIKAAVMYSPSSSRQGSNEVAFGGIRIPCLLMTGTRDGGPIGGQTPETRVQVYPALSPGSKYELVLDGAEHSAFTGGALPGEAGRKNPNHHRAMLAITTAFWDAYLMGDKAAREWLDGPEVRSVLEQKDRWQRK